jgi:hypothetical protein
MALSAAENIEQSIVAPPRKAILKRFPEIAPAGLKNDGT